MRKAIKKLYINFIVKLFFSFLFHSGYKFRQFQFHSYSSVLNRFAISFLNFKIKMYTKNFLKVFHFVLYLPNLVGSFPVNVDPKSATFYMSEKSKKRNTRATLLYLFVVMPFYLFRTWEIWAWKRGNANKYFHMCYAISFVAVMETVTLLHIRWKRDDICVAYSRMVRCCRRFEGK